MQKPFLEFFKIVHVIGRQKANLDRVIYAGQFFIRLKIVHLAYFDVQKHHVVRASLEACKRIGRIAFRVYLKTGHLQAFSHHLHNLVFIVYYQDASQRCW